MFPAKVWLWQKAPALRLLVPFVAGILLQWYAHPQGIVAGLLLVFFLTLAVVISWAPLRIQYKAAPLQGFALTGFIAATAMCLVQWNDIQNNNAWFGNQYKGKKG